MNIKDLPKTCLNSYYLSMRPEVFNEMQILMGPKTNSADRIIVEALCKKLIPEVDMSNAISNSKLKIRK